MNCLYVRRCILEDPRAARRTAAEHLAGCAPCAEFVARIERADGAMAAALAVAAPGRIAQRILASTLTPQRERRRLLAAAAFLATGIAAGAWVTLEGDDPLALAGIDFVVEEEANAILTAGPADPAALERATRRMGVSLPGQLGELRYIGTCPFDGTLAYHVIATTPHGKVTLLLLPQRRIEAPGSARARGLRAVVRAAAQGGLAAVGESRRGLERACGMVLQA